MADRGGKGRGRAGADTQAHSMSSCHRLALSQQLSQSTLVVLRAALQPDALAASVGTGPGREGTHAKGNADSTSPLVSQHSNLTAHEPTPLEKPLLLSLAAAGATQPGSAMPLYADLRALNKSSSKVATFAVRVVGGKTVEYTFKSKRSDKDITQNKFEARLVGISSQHYCVGFVKGTAAQVQQAKDKFTDGSVWELSKVVLDVFTQSAFISTPVLCRVDVLKSTMVAIDNEDTIKQMPDQAIPPRTVAEIAGITSRRAMDLIAIVKSVGEKRETRSGQVVADVALIDNSVTRDGTLATIRVAAFDAPQQSKLEFLRAHVGEPAVFFNLSVNYADGQLSVQHYQSEEVQEAPDCEKTTALRAQKEELTSATEIHIMTSDWTPQQPRDVSGLQPISCSAFLDFTTESPDAKMPSVVQVMWAHLEEPDPDMEVKDTTGERIWFRTPLRDATGSTPVGIPQKFALELANASTKEDFLSKHASGQLNLPLLCHVRITRNCKEMAGGRGEPQTYVNHTVASVEPMQWSSEAAPNAAYKDVLRIVNHCPPHGEGIAFAYLQDIEPDPHYGFRLSYDGRPGPLCTYVAALVCSEQKSTPSELGNAGFKVITENVKDGALEVTQGAAQPLCYTLVGYCTMNNLPEFKLDPPRAKKSRFALALLSRKDEEGLHIHKLECVEPEHIENAVLCMRKLRSLCKQVQPETQEKRSHAVAMADGWAAAGELKRARTLHTVPTDVSLGEPEERKT